MTPNGWLMGCFIIGLTTLTCPFSLISGFVQVFPQSGGCGIAFLSESGSEVLLAKSSKCL